MAKKPAKKKAAKKKAARKQGMKIAKRGLNQADISCPIGTHPEVVIEDGVATVKCVPD